MTISILSRRPRRVPREWGAAPSLTARLLTARLLTALLFSTLLLTTITGCGDDDEPPIDGAGFDAGIDGSAEAGLPDGGGEDPDGTVADGAIADSRTPTPQSLTVEGERGRLVVTTDPLAFRIEDDDGTARVMAAGDGGLWIATARNGDTRYFTPESPTPRNIRFEPLDFGITAATERSITLATASGKTATLTVDAPRPGVFHVTVEMADDVADMALMRLRLAADDGAYHGLGERFGHADARGTIVPMQLALGGTASGLNEHHVPVPFFVSPLGYGVFVETREAGAFDVAASDPDVVAATFEERNLSVWFYLDEEDPRQVVAMFAEEGGLPRLPPRWAFAPMHWRNEWTSRAVLEDDAARIRTEDIPCTSFWIDNPWQVSYNDLVIDEARFPEADEMLAALRADGYQPLLWSTPYFDAVDEGAAPQNEAEELFLTSKDNDWLVRQNGVIYLSPASPGATGAMIDFTNDDAAALWKSRLAPLVDSGITGFKLDYAEDILSAITNVRTRFQFSDGRTERELHNLYSVIWHETHREVLDERSDEGGFLIVRQSTWGGQGVADIIWPGDLDNDFREGRDGEVGGLPAAVTAIQSLAASGFPNFGSDTGGYRGGMPTREALLRWAEHTAFTPILQLGGAGEHHNPWLYDEEAGAIYRTLARAHMALVPYLRMHAIRASQTGYPPVSAPALAYPDDRAGWSDPYAYLLGEDIFVAPVVTEGATTRDLHLPPGTWMHWFTGEAFEGPADITVSAPIGAPPVFVRRGAIIPLLPNDIDTLAPIDDPVIVDETDRPYVRALVLPEGARSVVLEEGPTIAVERTADAVRLHVTPSAAMGDVRIEIPRAFIEPPITGPVAVTATEGTVMMSTADDVRSGCVDTCYFADDDVVLVSVRRDGPTTIEIR